MNKNQQELTELLAKITDLELMGDFLEDLLTKKELEDLSTRLQLIKQLDKGTTQRQISKNLKVGIATVTRGSKELKNKDGGFSKVLKKYYK